MGCRFRERIVVLAGGLGNTASMAQVIGPLSRERQVIGIDLEGHGRTAPPSATVGIPKS